MARQPILPGLRNYCSKTGSVKLNTDPSPNRLVTDNVPPWASMIARLIANPIPVPQVCWLGTLAR